MTYAKDCRRTREALPELLFDQASVPATVQAHVGSCADCQKELQALKGTVTLLDDWHAPEPSVYFNARMTAKLREEQQRGPQTLLARVQSWFVLTNLPMKPIAGGALALVLAIGGGTYLETAYNSSPAPQGSAAVRDLQSLDENAQVFQQMNSLDQLDQQDNDDGGAGSNL